MKKHIVPGQTDCFLCKTDYEKMIAAMREAGLTSNSTRSYTRTTLASTLSLGSGSADAKASLFTAITAKGSNPPNFSK